MMKSCSKIKTVVIIQPLKIIKKKPFCKNINRIPKQGLKEINNLSTLSEKLSLSLPRIRTTNTTYFEEKCQSTISI